MLTRHHEEWQAGQRRWGLIADLEDVTEREFDGTVVRPLVIVLTMGRRRE